jgi:catechol 2,3-dioxygenase-like lactoylglutathione lyase family enzyme
MTASIIFTYYRDLGRAADFYVRVMGLEVVVDQGYAKILQLTPRSFLGAVDGEGHASGQRPKSVIIATVTGEVDRWYAHLVAHGVEILSRSDASGSGSRLMAVGQDTS